MKIKKKLSYLPFPRIPYKYPSVLAAAGNGQWRRGDGRLGRERDRRFGFRRTGAGDEERGLRRAAAAAGSGSAGSGPARAAGSAALGEQRLGWVGNVSQAHDRRR
jgi:hypothetical protein